MQKNKILFLSKTWWSDLLISFPIWNEKVVEMVTKQKSGGVCNHYEDVWPIYFNVNKKKQDYNGTEKITKHPFSAPQNTGWVVKANTLNLTEIFFKSIAMYNYLFKLCILRTSAITLNEIRTIILNAAWHTPTTSSISKGLTKDSPNSRMYLHIASRDYFLSALNQLIQEQVSGAASSWCGESWKGYKATSNTDKCFGFTGRGHFFLVVFALGLYTQTDRCWFCSKVKSSNLE